MAWCRQLAVPATAFTFVEMILVLLLIGVLVGSVVVSLEGRQESYALRMAAKDLAATIRFAASESQTTNQLHRVVFDESSQSYWVQTIGPNEEYVSVRGWAGQRRPLNEGVTLVRVSKDDVPLDVTHLPFAPGGSGFHGVIELSNSQNKLIQIEVVRETAQVHVVE